MSQTPGGHYNAGILQTWTSAQDTQGCSPTIICMIYTDICIDNYSSFQFRLKSQKSSKLKAVFETKDASFLHCDPSPLLIEFSCEECNYTKSFDNYAIGMSYITLLIKLIPFGS